MVWLKFATQAWTQAFELRGCAIRVHGSCNLPSGGKRFLGWHWHKCTVSCAMVQMDVCRARTLQKRSRDQDKRPEIQYRPKSDVMHGFVSDGATHFIDIDTFLSQPCIHLCLGISAPRRGVCFISRVCRCHLFLENFEKNQVS